MIHARGLTKSYRTGKTEVAAVRGVDLDVQPGEIVGFLGPNGAGKTTMLRMLTTLLTPTSGTATVAGHDLITDPVGVRRSIGYVAQSGSTLPAARAGEEIVDHARMYGVAPTDARPRGHELFDQLELDGLWQRTCESLSGGQRRRLDIAMGLVHSPGLVFLDEPTTGLDPQSRANLWEHIAGLRSQRGATVFLTTHYLDEADALCDRILIIDNGQIVASGTPEDLKRGVSGDTVTLTLADPARAHDASAVISTAAVQGFDPSVAPVVEDGRVRFHVTNGGRALPSLLRALDSGAVVLEGVEVHRPTLDDVFLSLTGRSLREQATAA